LADDPLFPAQGNGAGTRYLAAVLDPHQLSAAGARDIDGAERSARENEAVVDAVGVVVVTGYVARVVDTPRDREFGEGKIDRSENGRLADESASAVRVRITTHDVVMGIDTRDGGAGGVREVDCRVRRTAEEKPVLNVGGVV
jgi:hypothetical protein